MGSICLKDLCGQMDKIRQPTNLRLLTRLFFLLSALFFVLCGCVWLVVCHNLVWFLACVLRSVCVSLAVELSAALVVYTTMLRSCWVGLVGVVSLC